MSSTGAHESPYCIEKVPVVQNREIYLQRQLSLWVNRDGYISPSTVGEIVTFSYRGFPETPEKDKWTQPAWNFERKGDRNPGSVHITGTVGPMWVVQPRRGERNTTLLSLDLESYAKILWGSLYCSNTSVSGESLSELEE